MANSRPKKVQLLFPKCEASVLPDPSSFFSNHLLSDPLPTNSFFQNFTLGKGDQPEYFHPYLIKPGKSSLSISYPSLLHNSDFFHEVFKSDITISSGSPVDQSSRQQTHQISSFSDLGVNLDFPSSNLRFFLVRGSPFITCSVSCNKITISTGHEFVSFSGNSSCTKYTARLNNNQTWLIYTTSPIKLTKHDNSSIHCRGDFSGLIRIAVLPTSKPDFEPVLDRFSRSYPVSGEADVTKPFTLEYKWEKRGHGDLLMLAHPLHLKLLSKDNESVTVLDKIKYRSIDGDLTGVIGDSWVLKPDTVPVTWHSLKGVKQDSSSREEIISALIKDVIALNSSSPVSSRSYHYGKVIARAARLALIAEEVSYLHVIPAVGNYLKDMIEPWLEGSFGPNSFVYDPKWGGLITAQGARNAREDNGYGIYNNHHYHLGYFLYAIAVLVKIDPLWGKRYRPQAYTLMADYMTLGRECDSGFPRLRCFDVSKLHSWAGGLTAFADGRNQVCPSEAVNAYYSAALLGLAYGDVHLVAAASTIMSLEIHASKMWWQVKEENTMYPKDFTAKNRLVGVLWSTKRDSSLWFGDREWKECRLGQQLLPLIPVSEILFSDVKFVKQLVKWTRPALKRDGVKDGWKGFVYALESVYSKYEALEKVRGLQEFDDGNSRSNLLWWVHSRD
ncbi:glycosyl hydrolase family 81 protein [Raphanus sativus]|uniref:glucan endo-1,3-beta-D-glucosidase n=1 Tax=Raphanus sativus TaxID=3726 RepID=A0A9W3CB37_RAPSA|nr:glucan endo-1,3-beta-D-glucosidase 1 [Raphanus sativus]XP_056856338.1 glucan endo-1,3-beta-D-glucosidase 1-like [Raphanus sativus]KAJ4867719.1 glycosyl hydrolase family 81 protein [Raphanus sativus]KAJ4916097.1 glycosyl hydrolase family 81 protein [Raphanus sativus]